MAQLQSSFAFSAEQWSHIVCELELSVRQAQVAELLVQGLGDKQISSRLGMPVPTLRVHMSRMFRRLGVEDRVQLVILVFAAACGRG